MKYYEICYMTGAYVVWEVTDNGCTYSRIKSFKTKKGAENWAKKQWLRVIWR